MQDQETLESVMSTLKVRITATIIAPSAARASDWPRGTHHYRVTLTYGGRSLRTLFSMGSAHTSGPTAIDVVGCLSRDMLNGASFAEWCGDLGFDPASPKAERMYKACERSEASMRHVFGDELAERLNRAEW